MVLTHLNLQIKINTLFSQKNSLLNQKIIILLFAIFFGIVSPLLLTESFIENFNNLRRNYLLVEKQNTENIEITTIEWNSIRNKKEIFFNNQYYDVQKVTQNKYLTLLTVVKDSFENVIKNSLNNNSSKKEKNKRQITFLAQYEILSNKKKCFFVTNQRIISNSILLFKYNSFLFSFTKPPIS